MSCGRTDKGHQCATSGYAAPQSELQADVAGLEQQLREATFISRFMGATSASLDPQDICAIASRHLYDFAPYRRIIFSLAPDFGLSPLMITPGRGEDGQPILKHTSPPATSRRWEFKIDESLQGTLFTDSKSGEKGIRLVLPEALGTVQIHFSTLNIKTFSTAILSEVTAHFARTLKNALTHTQVKEMASKDSLTGLFNRRVFDELLAVEVRRKELMPISLLLIDLDDFKKVNDTFGHPAGDEVLATVGRILKEGCRGSDLVARYGGEEFAIMLPATSASLAFEIAQRLRTRLSGTVFHFNGQHQKLTASIGIAYTTGGKTDSIAHLVSRADQALYRAKKNGKNTTYIYTTKAVELNKRHQGRETGFTWLRTA